MASGDVPRPEIVVDDDVTVDPMTGLQDLGALWLSATTDGLYQALLSGPGRPPSSDPFEAVSLFRRHHADDPEGAGLTALLLVTERRWRGAAASYGWLPTPTPPNVPERDGPRRLTMEPCRERNGSAAVAVRP